MNYDNTKPEASIGALNRGITVPSYSELPTIGPDQESHSWNFFGRGDDFGCLNFITQEVVRRASNEVALGKVVNLNLPIGEPQPQFWADREPPQHHVIIKRNVRDDYIDKYFPQGSTQIDGFQHMRYREFGFFGGRQDEDLENGQLGIGRWAERGLITRGVLADVYSYMTSNGTPPAPGVRLSIGPDLIEQTLAAQESEVRRGDALLIRTGWLGWYTGLPSEARTSLADKLNADRHSVQMAGISPSREMAAWLWDSGVSVVALDTPTAEALPYMAAEGWAHHRLLVLLGMPIGELWWLDSLAEACDSIGRYSFLLTTAPINVPAGVATPANAYAVL